MANSWSDRRGGSAIPHFDQRELALALRVVRGFDVRSEACDGNRVRGRSSASALALFLVFLLGLLHTAAVTRFPSYPVGAAASAAFGTGHEDVSMQFKKVAAVVSSALAVSAGSHAQDAVQWRVEDDGNGHWYCVNSRVALWSAARESALAVGADLISIETHPELIWLQTWVPSGGDSYLVGGIQTLGSATPSVGWRWLTGVDFAGLPLEADDNPCGTFPVGVEDAQQDCLELSWGLTKFGDINDGIHPPCNGDGSRRSIIEWSADCNSDGIVDYGQIRAGELVDANANNIPDCCEQGVSCAPCPGDVDESGTVNGVDLAAILAVWGSDGGKYPRADINNDGEVNGADLATVLGSWGSCK